MCLKSYILRKTCGFAQKLAVLRKLRKKKLRKTKISCHAQLSQKIIPVLRKLRKINSAKPRKTHCVSCAKIAQKFAKIKFARK